jgi:hypothetical protein
MNKKCLTLCANCQKQIMRKPFNHNTGKPIIHSFCDNQCKGQWQLINQKPQGVTRDWLVQKYEIEKFDCAEIGRMVGRDTKSVWNWMNGFGIATRGRGAEVSKQWKNGSRVHPGGFPHSNEAKEKMRQARMADGHVPYNMADGSHYMKGRFGENHHGWKGGLTPDRSKIAASDEWKSIVKLIWNRADARCERCGRDHRFVDNRTKDGFHIHHIVPFYVEKFRMIASNLVLLCRPCHHFVHSKRNTKKEFIGNGN